MWVDTDKGRRIPVNEVDEKIDMVIDESFHRRRQIPLIENLPPSFPFTLEKCSSSLTETEAREGVFPLLF